MLDVEETSTAQAPFDNPDSDIILRSSDSVSFHVFKIILSLASPVFKDMFALPQPQSDASSSMHIIPMAESSTTLDSLLLLCYPALNPTFSSLDDAKAVLEAARKYDMAGPLSCASDLVMAQFLSTEPFQLYALACRFRWKQHARVAASQTLLIKDLVGHPTTYQFAEMRDITGLDYHRLIVYHYKCGVAAKEVGESLAWLEPGSSDNMQMWKCALHRMVITRTIQVADHVGKLRIIPWFDEYLILSREELYAKPCESTIWKSTSYNRAILKAQECSECRIAVVDSMDRFRTQYANQVKKVIAMVELEVD